MYEVASLLAGSAVVLAVGAYAVNKFIEQYQGEGRGGHRQHQRGAGGAVTSTTSYFETNPAQRDVDRSQEATDALTTLKALAEIPVETGNTAHEAMLKTLWSTLRPGVTRPDRITRMWGQIGFQGTDPTTDFRGMGELALRCLTRVVLNHAEVHERCLREEGDRFFYFFAIAGINLCQSLYRMLNWHNELVNHLYKGVDTSSEDAVVNVFAAALADAWLQFDNFYITEIQRYLEDGGPPALVIMQFESIRNKFELNLFVRWERAAQANSVTFFEQLQQAGTLPTSQPQ